MAQFSRNAVSSTPTRMSESNLSVKYKVTRPIRLLLGIVLILFTIPPPAYAYLDPGSGSMFLQLVLGGAAGIAVILQLFWRRILSLLGIRRWHHKLDNRDDR
jgi:hypothetical protein